METTVERATPEARHRPVRPPHRAASWLTLTPQQVWRVGLTFVLAQSLLRMLLGFGTYFVQDDFVFYSKGALEPFSWSFLFQDRGNHLMPAGQAITWVLARVAPLDHPTAILTSVLIQLLASLAVLGLLREMFGLRTGILAPLSFYLFGALTLPAFLWWAASLNALGFQLAIALALRFQLCWIRTRRAGWAVAVLLSTLLGLLFFEKAVLILPLLVGITWVVERDRGALRDLGRVLVHHWQVWVLLAVLVGAWGALYAHQVSTAYATPVTSSTTSDLIVDALGHGIVPSLFGGPWAWAQSGVFLGFAPSPPLAWLLASWAGLLILGGLTLMVRRGSGRMMVVAFGYLAADMVLLVWGRSGAVGPGVGLEFRYYADAAIVLALLIGYAFLPMRDERQPWRPEARGLLQWVRLRGDVVRGVAWICLACWLVGAIWSTVALGVAWRANFARPYIETAKSQLAALPRDTVLLDEPVPDIVALAWFAPYNGTSYVFAPLHDRPAFGTQTDHLRVITSDGTIRDAEVEGIRSRVGTSPGCGWPISAAAHFIPLESTAYAWTWTVKIGYLAGADTDAVLHLGDGSTTVRLFKGAHVVYVPVVGGGSAVRLDVAEPGVGVCVDRVDVGTRSPVPLPTTPGAPTP